MMKCNGNNPNPAAANGTDAASVASTTVDPATLTPDGAGTCHLTLEGLPSEVCAFSMPT